jgi:TfoX/Sxy family transcriptional regulator of competence genes
MAYSESLADRIRTIVGRTAGVTEKKMFGGVGFSLNGNMLVGVWKTSLIVRVGPDQYDEALAEEHVHQFDITGREMRGWVLVEADGVESDAQLRGWIERGLSFVQGLHHKTSEARPRKKAR